MVFKVIFQKRCDLSVTAYSSSIRHRNFALWSMKKDPDLESALSRKHRWIINNQIKNIILRCPNQVCSINFLQKKFKTLDLQGKALNWLKKYPCCFDIYLDGEDYYCRLSKRVMALVAEEELVKEEQEPVFANRLAKLLMMSSNHSLNVVKINELRRNFGFPDDYLIRIIPKYPELFRLVNYSGRKNSMEIELMSWKHDLAVSAIELAAQNQETLPSYSCHLPSTWVKSLKLFDEFNSTPYITPYSDPKGFSTEERSKEMDKRAIGLVHELLSLSLWKKASIQKLCHFRKEFCLPDGLNVLLLKHPGIFYVSNKYQMYTVVLRDGYNGSELIDKDPLVVVKDKFGELMQEGLHEYNRRHYLMNLEKRRKKGLLFEGKPRMESRTKTDDDHVQDDQDRPEGGLSSILDPDERKRFYKILFDDNPK